MCTLKEFLQLCDFLRSARGQDKITMELRRERLARAGGGEVSADVMAAITQLELMRTDYVQRTKEINTEADRQIAELEKQISLLKEERDDELERVKTQYVPASEYQPLTSKQIGKYCWKMAKERNPALANVVVPTNEQVRAAAAIYRDEVTRGYARQFVIMGDNRQRIMEWVKAKILSFRQEGNHRGAKRLTHILEAMGGGPTDEVPPHTEEENPEPSPDRRESTPPTDDDLFNASGDNADRPSPPPETGGGDQGQSSTGKRKRRHKRGDPSGKPRGANKRGRRAN